MRITERRLRSIIRSVIIEGMVKNTALDDELLDNFQVLIFQAL